MAVKPKRHVNTPGLVIGFAALFVAAALGLAQEAFITQLDQSQAFDLYTASHLLAPLGIFFVFMSVWPGLNDLLVAGVILAATILFEPFEQIYLFNRFPRWGDFLEEIPMNIVADAVANVVGIAAAVVMWRHSRPIVHEPPGDDECILLGRGVRVHNSQNAPLADERYWCISSREMLDPPKGFVDAVSSTLENRGRATAASGSKLNLCQAASYNTEAYNEGRLDLVIYEGGEPTPFDPSTCSGDEGVYHPDEFERPE